MQKIFSTAAMTLAAIAAAVAITSCSDDDDFMGNNGQAEFANDMNTRSVAFTGNPEDLAENQHVGAQIVKSVAGYGDSVVFTCLTDKAPFYFVHVSGREYSASEMDAMQYQQNMMAPDQAALENLAKALQDYTYSLMGNPYRDALGKPMWPGYKYDQAQETFAKVFPGWKQLWGYPDRFGLKTPEFWYRNAVESYPYVDLKANAYTYQGGDNTVERDSHFCYASTSSHRLMFYVVGHSANPQDQAEHDAKYAPADSCYFGGTVTKNIDNYGEAKFVCVSQEAPYYFIHVSDEMYSPDEKDAKQFQQNEYAVTYDLLSGIAKDAFKMAQGILTTPTKGSCCTGYTVANVYCYSKAECQAVCDKLNPYFKHFECTDTEGYFTLKRVWVKSNDYSYPYGGIFLDFKCEGGDVSKCRNYYTAQNNNFMCYSSADPCYAMFAFKVE